jgi:hypothetical protein
LYDLDEEILIKLDTNEASRLPIRPRKNMFSLNMLLTSLPIHQYFLCQPSDIPPYMEQPIEPHEWPYTGGNIDPVSNVLT